MSRPVYTRETRAPHSIEGLVSIRPREIGGAAFHAGGRTRRHHAAMLFAPRGHVHAR
ncbi:hypothetical protein OG948_37435 (plasmid) [Embleya sp. NBC_00888]|uniref:hypothetical protein n=1 Tax=Embleya sp. NBC_00888 TaxID=2975960 RepID=UPI002F90679F|nr:hypothetical protein OG948_37435 [Embleya sp. NBC_00888]